MSGAKLVTAEARAISLILSAAGKRKLMANACAGVSAIQALMFIANDATRGKWDADRVEQLAGDLMESGTVRDRLRKAGFRLPIRNERELAKMGRTA